MNRPTTPIKINDRLRYIPLGGVGGPDDSSSLTLRPCADRAGDAECGAMCVSVASGCEGKGGSTADGSGNGNGGSDGASCSGSSFASGACQAIPAGNVAAHPGQAISLPSDSPGSFKRRWQWGQVTISYMMEPGWKSG